MTAVSDERGCFKMFRMLSMPRMHQVPISYLAGGSWITLGTVTGPVSHAVPLTITVSREGRGETALMAVIAKEAVTECARTP